MKQLSSNFINMAVSLTVICVLAALLLSYFVELTQEKIAESDKEKQSAAVTEVLPFEGAEFTTEKVLVDADSLTIYRATVAGSEVGVAVESYSNNGFNGQIKVMVGFDTEGNLLNYSVLDQKETPGLGTKMVDWFKPQVETKKSLVESIFGFQIVAKERQSSVIGKNSSKFLTVSKDGGDIDAITAATISSRAFLDAINRAFRAVNVNVACDGTSGASTMHHECEEKTDSATIDGTSSATAMTTAENSEAACNSNENLGGADNE